MSDFELRPIGASEPASGVVDLAWPSSTEPSASIKANVDPWLTQFGGPSSACIDLVRIAAGAYFADRLSPRGAGYSRTINLRVRLVEPNSWGTQVDPVCDLLHWLTGDSWNLELSSDGLQRPVCKENEADTKVKSVSLLSGGLDFAVRCLASRQEATSSARTLGQYDSKGCAESLLRMAPGRANQLSFVLSSAVGSYRTKAGAI